MDVLTIILIVIAVILLAAVIFLAVRTFGGMSDEERKKFLDACGKAVKIVLAALEDGKITIDELKDILRALLEILATFNKADVMQIASEFGAAKYLTGKTAETSEIVVEQK